MREGALSNSYRDLIVWQKAMNTVETVYKATEFFPKYELYTLVSQMRRAAISIPSNIAEGQGRNSPSEFSHFLGNARGSLVELETQILISERLRYLRPAQALHLLKQLEEVSKLLNGLLLAIRKKAAASKLETSD